MKLSFKKRIALFNTTAAAVTTAILFVVIYAVVFYSSYRHLDQDILLEKEEILNTLDWNGDSIIINKMPEWEEAEHKKVEVNPTFIQIVDAREHMIFKSANLQSNHFLFDPANETEHLYNSKIENQRLRLGQFPIRNDQGKIIGQLTIGISQQESYNVLNNLLFTLCISFPLLLIVLYAATYFAASRAISPVQQLIKTTAGINDSNINTRLTLPENEDEIYQLAKTINELLNRIGNSIQQQKQFAADASHEMRTPLTAIRGMLEVLLRKKREPEQYEEKLKEVIGQTDRLNQLLDQLLQLARLESGSVKKEKIKLNNLIKEVFAKWVKEFTEKGVQFQQSISDQAIVNGDHFFLTIIFDNLISNALKYGSPNSNIICRWDEPLKTISLSNEGENIPDGQIPRLFDRFYRADDSRSSEIAGNGLGLSIVKKLCDLQHIHISVTSQSGITTFSLAFTN